uniref:Uncharacterized protein n=2 Tax=Nymphaea colorata TaxID=210225 RepID=A0A5K1BWT4_9MAGN
MDSRAIEDRTCNENVVSKGSNFWEQLKVPSLRGSMSVTDLVNHLEHCITEQMTSGNPAMSGEDQWNKDVLDEITQHLLSDSQNPLASDEQCLMSRVNSLYCLLQKDANTDHALHMNSKKKVDAETSTDEESDDDDDDERDTVSPLGGKRKMSEYATSSKSKLDNVNNKQNSAMSRKDSLGDLLLGLPRIASLPKFLFNPSDDGGRAR